VKKTTVRRTDKFIFLETHKESATQDYDFIHVIILKASSLESFRNLYAHNVSQISTVTLKPLKALSTLLH